MRRKVSTQLEDVLFRRARIEAVRQGRPINEVIAEALSKYLDERGTPAGPGGVVEASWGVLAVTADVVDRVLTEEEDFLGA